MDAGLTGLQKPLIAELTQACDCRSAVDETVPLAI